MRNGFGWKSCTGIWDFGVGLGLAVGLFLAGSAGAQEDSIKLFSNLTKQRATAEFSDLKGNAVVFEKDNRETTGYMAKTIELAPIGKMYEGEASQAVIHTEAKANAADNEIGVEAKYHFVLPKGRCYQLQGCGRVLEGKEDGADIAIQVRILGSGGKYEDKGAVKGIVYYNDVYEDNWKFFVADLTDFAGQEIELALSLKSQTSYSKVGDREKLTPERISADWGDTKIVDSSFRVKLGKQEGSVNKSKTSSRKLRGNQTNDWSDVTIPIGTEEKVLTGRTNPDWYLFNPGESGVNTVKIPGTQPWFAAYFTSTLSDGAPGDTPASPRMFDFSTNSAYNCYNSDVTTLKNKVLINANNAAKVVITPGAQYDDNWPNHVAIASATMGRVDGTGNYLVHAFVHCEDVYREQIQCASSVYEFINYARSYYGTDFAKSFMKMTWLDGQTNRYPIIQYEISEDDLFNTGKMNGDLMYGSGSPSVIEKDGYYYMIYHNRAIRPKSDWQGRNGIDRYYVYGSGGNTIDGSYYGMWPSISIARALVSQVNSSNISSCSNPWYKYYERESSGNYWQQPGFGGKASILWNSWLDSSNRRSEFTANSQWRGFPKVSYNSWAAGYSDVGDYMMICHGKTSTYGSCVLIHNSNDLLNWSSEGIVVLINDFNKSAKTGKKRDFPTIIGDSGQSVLTTEINELYYELSGFDLNSNPTQDMYRVALAFER